eukprot:1158240-Pelagomonas_calceolata.AAC.3
MAGMASTLSRWADCCAQDEQEVVKDAKAGVLHLVGPEGSTTAGKRLILGCWQQHLTKMVVTLPRRTHKSWGVGAATYNVVEGIKIRSNAKLTDFKCRQNCCYGVCVCVCVCVSASMHGFVPRGVLYPGSGCAFACCCAGGRKCSLPGGVTGKGIGRLSGGHWDCRWKAH